jgi:glyoxylase-like metal-dependent hydrolase (beta-lactamase superfamily II)
MLPSGRVHRFALGGVNAYLVDDDGDWTLVDAGMPWHTDRIRNLLAEAGVDPADVERVLLTHYDLDHVGTLASLGLDAPIHVAEPDASYFEGTRVPPLSNHKGLFQRVTRPLVTVPDLPLERVVDGETIGGFTAHRTPGHTPGHAAFVHEGLDAAFVGDLVTGDDDGTLGASPWVICYDAGQNERSIRAIADRAADVDVVAMGHGNPVRTDGGRQLRRLADRL